MNHPSDVETSAAEVFFQTAHASFATACDQRGTADLWLRIARRIVRFRFAGARISEVIAPVFAHLQTSPQPTADLTILLWDAASTGIDLPPIQWQPHDLDRAGKVRSFCDARFAAVHEPDTGQFWMLDRRSATAVVWMNDVDAVPLWDRIHPLRKLLHAWARGFGADLVHAGAVGIDGAGVLVVGPGGTGKSTTVLAAMQAGLSAAGDDYVLVDAGSPSGPPPTAHAPTAHALYGTMRLHQAHLDRFPALMTHHDHVFEEPWSGQAKVTSYISRHLPDRLTAEVRLVGIVIPQVVSPQVALHESLEVARETPARALLALAPSSLLQIDPTDAAMFTRMVRLCRLLPCWRLPLGPDLACVADRLARLISAQA
jgi:hypothetical protein